MITEILKRKDIVTDFSLNPLNKLARSILNTRLDALKAAGIVLRDRGCKDSLYLEQEDVVVDVLDDRFYPDVLIAGSNGAASAYRDGYWKCSDLTNLFRRLIKNMEQVDDLETGFASLGNWWLRRGHNSRSNTRNGSRKNIRAHYDLGNDLFEAFLDRTMTYSSGYFKNEESSLEDASTEKLDRICRKLKLKSHHRVIEIGTGWGSFAIHAAENYGCHVTTTTISKEQFRLAKQRIKLRGLEDRIDIRLCDYRDLQGKYDRLVSIEMIEAVGHKFLPVYFSTIARLLKEDGQACIQSITMPDSRYEQYLRNSDFIQQFIFPGSCVPSLGAIQDAVNASSDLRISHMEDFGLHYARTLREWYTNFMVSLSEIKQMGYSDEFIRLWQYYLCYCEAGFLERYTSVVQLVFDKPKHVPGM